MADVDMAEARPSEPSEASAPSTSQANGAWPSGYRDRSDVPPVSGFSCAATLRGHEGAVTTVKFSHDGARLCSGSTDRTARIWDVKSGACLCVLKGHDKARGSRGSTGMR